MMPTDKEILQAKNYIASRLKAEKLAVSALDAAVLSAIKRIVDISHKYNIPPEQFRFSADPKLQKEVSEVLRLLREALYSEIRELDTFSDEDDKDDTFIAPILTEEDHGKTFRQRLADYTSRWGYETEAVIAAAGLEGIRSKSEITESIRSHLEWPYENPLIKKHRRKGAATRLNETPHYGKGRIISAYSALSLLLTTVVAKGWMQNWARRNSGKRGYYVFRGSSYPCDICDAQTGFLHDISDVTGLPPYHNHCVCFPVYID